MNSMRICELPPLDTAGLTAREIEIVRLAATHSDAQIAARLGIGTHTVKTHLQHARDKWRDASGKAAHGA